MLRACAYAIPRLNPIRIFIQQNILKSASHPTTVWAVRRWLSTLKNMMSNFGLILEKLEIGPYPGHDLFRTLENSSRGKMKANWTSKKFPHWKISCLIRKTWSRPLIRTISRGPFEKTVKNMTKMTKNWKILESLEIDQDWSRKLPEASKTDFKWFWRHGKPSKAISKNAKISWKMDPTGHQMVEISRCRYAAAQCQNQSQWIFSWCEALFKKIRCQIFA